jgi:hypothetical protein
VVEDTALGLKMKVGHCFDVLEVLAQVHYVDEGSHGWDEGLEMDHDWGRNGE